MTDAAGSVGVGERAAHPHDVFVSYSSKNKAAADMVCNILESQGVRCWMAPRDIIPGQDWAGAILDAIESSRAFVLIFSGFSNASPQVKREVERAANHNKPIIPFRIENVIPSRTLEFFISTPHWLDALTPPLETHARVLAGDILRLLGDVPGGPEALHEGPQSARRRPQTRTQSAPPPSLDEPQPAARPPASGVGRRPTTTIPLAATLFLGACIVVGMNEGSGGIGIPIAFAPVFTVFLSLGLWRGGWLGALGAMALAALSLGACIGSYLIAWEAITSVRSFPADRAPLREADYLVGGLAMGAALSAGYFALLILFGRRLATPSGLRNAAIYTVILTVFGGLGSGFLGLWRISEGDAPLWYRLGFPTLWMLGLGCGAFAVASGVANAAINPAGLRALDQNRARRNAGDLPRTSGWVVAIALLVFAVLAPLAVMAGLHEASVPRGGSVPFVGETGGAVGGGGSGGKDEGAVLYDVAPPPEEASAEPQPSSSPPQQSAEPASRPSAAPRRSRRSTAAPSREGVEAESGPSAAPPMESAPAMDAPKS